MLTALHKVSLKGQDDSSNTPCEPPCPSHDSFSLQVEETLICDCGAQQKSSWDYSTFSHHFYVNEIFEDLEGMEQFALLRVKESNLMKSIEASTVMKCESRLQEYIRRQWELTRFEMCPSECPNPKSKKILRLLQSPKVFMINLIWKDFKPHLLKILQVYASIPYCISLDNIYNYNTPTTHVLKSAIFYGSGHYICAIRATASKLWYKIDDEMAKKVGSGSWKDLVFDSLKNRFYPVGLFYEESHERDSNNINAEEWIEIERMLVQFLQKNQEVDENPDRWACQCGSKNDGSWNVCSACNRIKPGVKGWVCGECTFINESINSICRSCGAWKKGNYSSKQSESVWECICSKKNLKSSLICEKCKKCKLCRNKITRTKCYDCYSSFECSICKQDIPKKDGRICYRCKQRTDLRCPDCGVNVTIGIFVCAECTSTLVKCSDCGKFNFPEDKACTYAGCSKVSSISDSPSKATTTLTSTDKTDNLRSSQQRCTKCSLSSKLCICNIYDKCAACSIRILTLDDKFCSKCLSKSGGSCSDCGSKEFTICAACLKNSKKCKKCRNVMINSEICENESCQSSLSTSVNDSAKSPLGSMTESIKKNGTDLAKRSSKLRTACKVCERELSLSYGFCLDCKLKMNSPMCKFCNCNVCRDLCEMCIRSTQQCVKCSHSYHIIEPSCPVCIN